MSTGIDTDDSSAPRLDAAALRLVVAGFALMLASAVVLWMRYGAGIFEAALMSLRGCF